MSEFWAGMAGAFVYGVFHAGSFFVQSMNIWLPLNATAAAHFLDQTVSWSGALSAAATFILITAYQLMLLGRRLWREVR